jgi:hypothetical protein
MLRRYGNYFLLFLNTMAQYLRITCGLLFGFAVGGYPSAQKPMQATPPENLGIVINKFCNGLNQNTATGDTIELLVLQKALDARGIILKDFSPKTGIEDYDNGGGFEFREDAAVWANIKAGTFIVLSWSNKPVQKFGDTLITSGLLNEEAFRAVNTGKNNLFNIAERDALMLKRKGSPFGKEEGCIHAFSAGLTNEQLDIFLRSTPILYSANKLTKETPYAIAETRTPERSAYVQPQGTAMSVFCLPEGKSFGQAHSVENQAVVDGVRRR